jgi:CRP-like cAMP-binding protein
MLIEHQKISEQFFSSAFLAGDDLFRDLSPASQNSLLAVKREKEFAPGETIFAGGAMPCCIYILTAGEAQIFYHGGGRVHRVKQNEILGLTEALSNMPYEISVKTVTSCRFECLSRDAFLDFLQNEPETCFRLLQMLGTNLHKLYQFLH